VSAADSDFRIERPATDIVQVLARKGRTADLPALLDCDLPGPGRALAAGDLTMLWLQPDGWLVLAPPAPEGALARRLKEMCGTAASVIDQTHGRLRLTLTGREARATLAKTCRVDLHPSCFGEGAVAAAEVAHIACTLHRHAGGYDLIVPATLAASLLDQLA
jgi:heterotetrameric sarcosine oxidase gamma subunit